MTIAKELGSPGFKYILASNAETILHVLVCCENDYQKHICDPAHHLTSLTFSHRHKCFSHGGPKTGSTSRKLNNIWKWHSEQVYKIIMMPYFVTSQAHVVARCSFTFTGKQLPDMHRNMDSLSRGEFKQAGAHLLQVYSPRLRTTKNGRRSWTRFQTSPY